jgi:TATA-box binding protein (TBP) (component of TFIID and TFIIIB)
MLTALVPSTLVAQGVLTHVHFHERDLIESVRPVGRVLSAACNYGDVLSPEWHARNPAVDPDAPLAKRGRKKKAKPKSNRVRQGNGKRFDTQISFEVTGDVRPGKVYDIKVFRNGVVSVPGGLLEDISDVRDAIEQIIPVISEGIGRDGPLEIWAIVSNLVMSTAAELVVSYLSDGDIDESTTIRLANLCAITRNYKTSLSNPRARIDTTRLNRLLMKMDRGDPLRPCEAKHNTERYPGLVLKYATPTPKAPAKKITMKIFTSGKIDIDGAVTREAAHDCHALLLKILDRFHEAVFEPRVAAADSASDTSDEDTDTVDDAAPIVNADYGGL